MNLRAAFLYPPLRITHIKNMCIFASENMNFMTEKNDKKQWGGRREGAGRPPTNSKLYSFRMPEELVGIIDMQPNKSEFVKECIAQRLSNEKIKRSIGEIYSAKQIKDIKLPFFDIGLVAGFPIPLDNDERAQDVELLKMLCPNPESSYLIRVQGDSMVDAGIESGDIVIVDKSNRNPTVSQVAVCEFNGEYTLKRFVKRDDCGWLVPANPNFPEIKITPDDDFKIWGTVTYIIHKSRE